MRTYSYGLSNGYYKPFLRSYHLFDRWVDGNEISHNYLTVQSDERFTYDSMYYNQAKDVHPPLYYFLLHIYIIYKLYTKKIKQAIAYISTITGSACINHLFIKDDFVTSQTKNNLTSFSGFFRFIAKFSLNTTSKIFLVPQKIPIIICGVVAAFFIVMVFYAIIKLNIKNKSDDTFTIKHWLKIKFNRNDALGFAMLSITVLSFLAVSKVAVNVSLRYAYNIYPFIIILIVWLIY